MTNLKITQTLTLDVTFQIISIVVEGENYLIAVTVTTKFSNGYKQLIIPKSFSENLNEIINEAINKLING